MARYMESGRTGKSMEKSEDAVDPGSVTWMQESDSVLSRQGNASEHCVCILEGEGQA